jgi:hypothetical protein
MDNEVLSQVVMNRTGQNTRFSRLEGNGVSAAKDYIEQKIIGHKIHYDMRQLYRCVFLCPMGSNSGALGERL